MNEAALRVEQGGLQTTLQDLGRSGWQRYGVPVGGAMDSYALRVANLLAGNPPDAAALEITLLGPRLSVLRDIAAGLAGGDLGASVDGAAWPPWENRWLRAGQTVAFKRSKSYGARAYLAAAGGIDVPFVLGSRATLPRAKLGGYEGRALAAGDALFVGALPASAKFAPRRVVDSALPGYALGENPRVRVILGPQQGLFTDEAVATFLRETYAVGLQSDRMGCRLEGAPLMHIGGVEIASEGTAFGAVQVPPSGQPIIMMADRPTTGGYAKIAVAATVDLPIAAQCAPGDTLRFEAIEADAARHLLRRREDALVQIAVGCRGLGWR